MLSNLPPGCRDSDIPGNRPGDIAADVQSEAECDFYIQSLRFYGLDSFECRALRNAFLAMDPSFSWWLADCENQVEREDIGRQMADEHQCIALCGGDPDLADEVAAAKVKYAKLEARLKLVKA